MGYRIVALDLLGHGNTSRPLNLDDYHLKFISQDVMELLDHDGIDTV